MNDFGMIVSKHHRWKWGCFTGSWGKYSRKPTYGKLRLHGKIHCNSNIKGCLCVSSIPYPSVLPWKKCNLIFLKGRNKGQCLDNLCHWFSPCLCPDPAGLVFAQLAGAVLRPAKSVVGPRLLLGPHDFYGDNSQKNGVSLCYLVR